MRFFVMVYKNHNRERCGYSYGTTHEQARDRFIKDRRRPSKKQLQTPVEMIGVAISEGGQLKDVRMYGAEVLGFPTLQSF